MNKIASQRHSALYTTLLLFSAVLLASVATGPAVMADTITHPNAIGGGSTTITMDFVTVGNSGNAADTTGYPNPCGSVDYVYRLGKYEVTADQWELVIGADSDVGNAGDWTGSQPTGGANWYEAAKFCNWLSSGDAATGVYTFTDLITNPTGVTINRDYRNSDGVAYFLPTTNEWYKAAYYDPNYGGVGVPGYWDYPTKSDSAPDGINTNVDTEFDVVVNDGYDQLHPNSVTNAGVASPYGTIGQGGNVFEWNEDLVTTTAHRIRGGYWHNVPNDLKATIGNSSLETTYQRDYCGFRVASVPEPGSITLLLCGAIAGLICWRRWR